MKLDLLKCKISDLLIDSWKKINDNGKHTVFVVNDKNILKGIITDGDIRRFLLKGGSLNEKVITVMNKNFVYDNIKSPPSTILKKLNSKIKIIPLVNDSFEFVDYYEFDKSFYLPVTQPSLKGNELSYLTDAFLSTWISSKGEYIDSFEEGFAKYNKVKYGVVVSNGTVALHLALVALGIKEGDEVIIPDLTFAATINAVLHSGATPVIVDIEEDSWCIDPNEIKKVISPKTKAIIPVHIYGQPCNMDAIMEISEKYKIHIIEDCAEAHGATYNGRKVGSFGIINCFSFFANKIITTGEGGMCLTNDKELYNKMRLLRDHGMSKDRKYYHEIVGFNYRMTNLQAAIGVAQLERIDQILIDRKNIEEKYKKVLSDIKNVKFQLNFKNREKVTWLVSILVENQRDKLIKKLTDAGIDARPFFYSLGKTNIYSKYSFSYKVSEKICASGLNLATSSILTNDTYKIVKNIFINTI